MIGSDAKVIGHRRVRVGEPRPAEFVLTERYNISLAESFRQAVIAFEARDKADRMWAAVVAFSEGGGCLPTAEPEKRTTDALIESDGHSAFEELVDAALDDERPVMLLEDNAAVNDVCSMIVDEVEERIKSASQWLADMRREEQEVLEVLRELEADSVLRSTSPCPPMPRIYSHAPDCGYHADQYPWECDCGAVPKRTHGLASEDEGQSTGDGGER